MSKKKNPVQAQSQIPAAQAAPPPPAPAQSLLSRVADAVEALEQEQWRLDEDLARAEWHRQFAQGSVEHHKAKIGRVLDPAVVLDAEKTKTILSETYPEFLVRAAILKNPGGWSTLQKSGADDETLVAKLRAWPEGTHLQNGPVYLVRGYIGRSLPDQLKALHVFLGYDGNYNRVPPLKEWKGQEVLALVRRLIGIPKPITPAKVAELVKASAVRPAKKPKAAATQPAEKPTDWPSDMTWDQWTGKVAGALGVSKERVKNHGPAHLMFQNKTLVPAARDRIKKQFADAKAVLAKREATAKPATPAKPAAAIKPKQTWEQWVDDLALITGRAKGLLASTPAVVKLFQAGQTPLLAQDEAIKAVNASVARPGEWKIGDRAYHEVFGWGEVRSADAPAMSFVPAASQSGQVEMVMRISLKREGSPTEGMNKLAPAAQPDPHREALAQEVATKKPAKKLTGPDVSQAFGLEEKGLDGETLASLRAAASMDRLAREEAVKRIVQGDGVSYLVTGMDLGEQWARFDLRPCLPIALWTKPTRSYEQAIKGRAAGADHTDLVGVAFGDAAAARWVISGGPVLIKAPV